LIVQLVTVAAELPIDCEQESDVISVSKLTRGADHQRTLACVGQTSLEGRWTSGQLGRGEREGDTATDLAYCSRKVTDQPEFWQLQAGRERKRRTVQETGPKESEKMMDDRKNMETAARWAAWFESAMFSAFGG
jgi:hypothetical protein